MAEPFAGGGIVGLSALFDGLVDKLTLVELDEDVGAVWKTILNGHGKDLAERIATFRLTDGTVRAELAKEPETGLDRAFQTILKNRVQRGGILAPGAGLLKKGENGNGLASRWYPETLQRRIREIIAKRDLITFVQGDGVQFIREHENSADMVFFIDPPYTVAGRRLYVHSELDHEELFRVISRVRGNFLMTYDNAKPIRDLAEKFGFDAYKIAMKNTHHAIMSELLIGRDLSWAREPVQLGLDTVLKNVGANGNAGG
jgi:DNA adenine methylase